MALYTIHDSEALKEMSEKAFLLNTIQYDQNDNYLSVVRHEALFAAYILTEKQTVNHAKAIVVNKLTDLPETIDLFNNGLENPVKINNSLKPYGVCLFNKWCGFNEVLIESTVTKKDANNVSKIIYEYVEKDSYKYYNLLTELEKKLFYFVSVTEHSPSLNIDEMLSVTDKNTKNLLKKLPENNIELGYHINEALSNRCLEKFDQGSSLYKLFKSGSRFDKVQLLRSCFNIGYVADAQNLICSAPIKSCLLEGLNEDDFFLSAPGEIAPSISNGS